MDEEKKIINIENNILNEEAVLKKEEKKIQELKKDISESEKIIPGNSLKDRAVNWLKKSPNLAFIGVMIFVIAVRFYYFWITKNQPLWWDEAEYMSTAKSFAGIIHFDYIFSLNRFPGFSMLVSLFYMIGISNEVILRFLFAFIPSILAIGLMYFVLTSMYSDKRIALISVAIFSVLWEHVFYSNRFHTENLSLIFEFLAIIILFRVYLKNKDLGFIKSKYALLWIALFTLICIMFRSGNMIFIPVVVFFLLIVNFYKLPNKFKLPSILAAAIFFVIAFLSIGFLAKNHPAINMFYHYELPISWSNLSVFYGFYQSLVPFIPSILFYAFLIGVIVVIGSILIFPEGLKKVNRDIENSDYKADIFNLILILAVLFFFIILLRQQGFEFRWFFALLPAMFAFTAKGLIKFGDFIQSLSKAKYLSIILIIILLLFGVYTQYNHGDMIVKAKIDSYSQVKDSGLWMKENLNPEDSIVSASLTQHRYYSERNVFDFYVNGSNDNESAFDAKILKYKPKYLVISAFEQGFTPKWAYDWPNKHNDTAKPVKVYTQNTAQGSQPVLVVYEIKY